MDYTLSEDQQQLVNLVNEFVARDCKPYLEKAGHEDFAWPLFRKLGELGLAAIPFPTEYGGGGLDYSTYAVVLEELSRLGSHLGGTVAVHGLPQLIINTFGTEQQKRKFLPPMARAELLGAFALTEPHAGSDAAAIRTRAEQKGNQYVLNGQKIWITHGGEADVYIVMAVTDKTKGAKGVSSFIVEKGSPGLTFGKRERPMGLPHHTREVFFEDCLVPRENLIGREGEGFKVAMTALDSGRITVAATSVGLAQSALDYALGYAAERKAFGREIADFQGIQFMLADMASAIEAARCVMRKAAYLRDRGLPFNSIASMAKLLATDAAMKVTTDAVQIYGGYGTSEDYPVQVLFREAKIGQIVEGTNQIQRMIIARDMLKKVNKK
ncbi:MAG TPA: acyl-CoA dehydrogenase family protein [Blastocatellia bacterium]|nr:acyl-CoA dehydrogenase family protein [Blastocatellia bacterium]